MQLIKRQRQSVAGNEHALREAVGLSMDVMLRIQAIYAAETIRAQSDSVDVHRYMAAETAT